MFSEEIKDIRVNKLNLSQEEFAQLLQVSSKTINRWERGESKPTGLSVTSCKNLKTIIDDKDGIKALKDILVSGISLRIITKMLPTIGGIIGIAGTIIAPSALAIYNKLIKNKQ